MRKFYLIASTLLILIGCKEAEPNSGENLAVSQNAENQEHAGKKLMETYCYSCHSPSAPMVQGRIAPPMAAIKGHYLLNNSSKKDFVTRIETFVNNPSPELSMMPGAIDKYNLMPHLPFPENSVKEIADFMYDNKIEEPDWFQAHWNNGPGFSRKGTRMNRKLFGAGFYNP